MDERRTLLKLFLSANKKTVKECPTWNSIIDLSNACGSDIFAFKHKDVIVHINYELRQLLPLQ